MLEAKHLIKTFGNLKAVNDVSFTVEDGTILGLIGQNGSGKTTMFRLILDLLTPEKNGEVLWDNKPLNNQVYNVVGYLPEERGLYEKLTVEQQIIYFAMLRGMEKNEIKGKIDVWMEKFNVKGKKTDLIKTLSKGNQQKVQLIATLIHEPKLVILDEPFSGLDPVNADYLKKGILDLKKKGSSIIFSSHNMNNVEEICDKLLMIHNGDRVLYGTVEEVRNSFGKTHIYVKQDGLTKERLINLPGVKEVITTPQKQFKLILEDEKYGREIFKDLSSGDYIETFSQVPPTLEEIFKLKAGKINE